MNKEDWVDEYKEYFNKVQKEVYEIKQRMLDSGWVSVCIEPNLMTKEEFIKDLKQRKG